jgi:DNA mismatch repair protein MutL
MGDIIKLLPESIANQIAAGEVIQRPASVVKELMENSIDAGSTNITLVVKNSGKTLIQVIDNGKGMSDTDARMSFERHATSKIRQTEDLFNINTMGFRGEALASIASIAEVEMKTRQHTDEVATKLTIKSSQVEEQTYCQAEPGTTISVKNLFFNVPARKKFLKSDSVELKYLLGEFKKIALAQPEISFTVIHNDNEIYNLPAGKLKKRLLNVFRRTYEEKLIRIDEATEVVKITGFIGDPEIAKRSKDEQYLFVNQRYIKSNYLGHAIKSAYQNLLEEGQYPFYLLYLEVDPASIDINVHPTKQEIKFDDERLIYNYLKVAIKHGLGRYSLSPQLDFDNEDSAFRTQPVQRNSSDTPQFASRVRSAPVMRNWQSLYNGLETIDLQDSTQPEHPDEELLIIPSAATGDLLGDQIETDDKVPTQLHSSYILVQIKSGVILVDQHQAHSRVLYEKYLHNLNKQPELVQKQLFPITFSLGKDKTSLMLDLIPELQSLGFEIQEFGGDNFIVHGIPAGLQENNIPRILEMLIDQYANNLKLDLSKNENLARAMAQSAAIPAVKNLETEEMASLIDELFACEFPYMGPTGKKCFVTFELKDLNKLFN